MSLRIVLSVLVVVRVVKGRQGRKCLSQDYDLFEFGFYLL